MSAWRRPKAGYRWLAKQLWRHFMVVSQEKSTLMRIAQTHFTVCTIFLCKWFHPLPHKKIPLCFAKLPLLPRNNVKHEKSVLWRNKPASDDLWDSCKHILWLSCKKKVRCMRIACTCFAVHTTSIALWLDIFSHRKISLILQFYRF